MSDYFYNPIKRDLAMIKSDTMSFGFEVKGLGGQEPDAIQFTCKEKLEDDFYLFAVNLNNTIDLRSYDEESDTYTYGVRIPPEDTAGLDAGRYFYDLELKVNNDIITLMIGRLTIEDQVTSDNITPPPYYEDGDNIAYPVSVSLTSKKAFTERFISNIARLLQVIYVTSDHFTTAQMADKVVDINDQILAIGDALDAITGSQSAVPLEDIASTINTIKSEIDGISDTINRITGGSSDIALADMSTVISTQLGLYYDDGSEVSY